MQKYLVGVGARVVLDASLGGEVVVVAGVLGYLYNLNGKHGIVFPFKVFFSP